MRFLFIKPVNVLGIKRSDQRFTGSFTTSVVYNVIDFCFLSIMVGGSDEAYEQVQPILRTLGTPILCGMFLKLAL